jgi:hypothetical protein
MGRGTNYCWEHLWYDDSLPPCNNGISSPHHVIHMKGFNIFRPFTNLIRAGLRISVGSWTASSTSHVVTCVCKASTVCSSPLQKAQDLMHTVKVEFVLGIPNHDTGVTPWKHEGFLMSAVDVCSSQAVFHQQTVVEWSRPAVELQC